MSASYERGAPISVLADRLLAVHEALDAHDVPHAFGGAIALAYCTLEPRGTRDIDVNIFVPATDAARILRVLPAAVVATDEQRQLAEGDGQVRLWWGDTPLDLFFDVHDFHVQLTSTVRYVPFEGATIPVLGCSSLAVFKAMFNRTRDWADIEAMVDAGTLVQAEAVGWVASLLGLDDPITRRLDALFRHG